MCIFLYLLRAEKALTNAVRACATNLIKVGHKLSPGGTAGVAMLSESRISIHTWTEFSYAGVGHFHGQQKKPPYCDPGIAQDVRTWAR